MKCMMLLRHRVAFWAIGNASTLSKVPQTGAPFATISDGIASSSKTEYPTSPKTGIGIVLLRKKAGQNEVLLVRRGKEPEKGKLTFPGGSLELGETMAECAARELMEETGLKLLNQPTESEPPPRLLSFPRPVDAIDCIRHDKKGRLQFHYTIIDIAALPEEADAQAKASDDAEEVLWVPVQRIRSLTDVAADHARIAEAACERFDIPESGS